MGRRERSGSSASQDDPTDGMEHLFGGGGNGLRFGRDKRLEEACCSRKTSTSCLCTIAQELGVCTYWTYLAQLSPRALLHAAVHMPTAVHHAI